MVTRVEGGVELANALISGIPTYEEAAYFQQNATLAQQVLSTVNPNILQSAGHFLQGIQVDKVRDYVSRVVQEIGDLWDVDFIKPLKDLLSIQFPPDSMIPYLMANPVVRKMYHQRRCEGYGERYIDLQPGHIGDDHYDYQKVMNGREQIDEDGISSWTTYYDLDEENEAPLTDAERDSICISWGNMLQMIHLGDDDPTSQYGARL